MKPIADIDYLDIFAVHDTSLLFFLPSYSTMEMMAGVELQSVRVFLPTKYCQAENTYLSREKKRLGSAIRIQIEQRKRVYNMYNRNRKKNIITKTSQMLASSDSIAFGLHIHTETCF